MKGERTVVESEAFAQEAPVLELQGVKKAFGQVKALRGVDLSARPGEILAIVGDNGAGKSTLVKIVSGLYRPDEGDILVGGKSVSFNTPADARAAGVATVYQDLALVECLDVATNMFLGQVPKKRLFVDRGRMERESSDFLRSLNVGVKSVRTQIGMLSGGQRQIVAFARVLRLGADIILLDEPTAALGVRETAHAAEMIRGLRQHGKAVVVVSHDIEFVFAVADRVQVMRLGTVSGIRRVSQTTRDEIVSLITGAKTDHPGDDSL
jgi:ABC-type sugar transport system ATPase subunit